VKGCYTKLAGDADYKELRSDERSGRIELGPDWVSFIRGADVDDALEQWLREYGDVKFEVTQDRDQGWVSPTAYTAWLEDPPLYVMVAPVDGRLEERVVVCHQLADESGEDIALTWNFGFTLKKTIEAWGTQWGIYTLD